MKETRNYVFLDPQKSYKVFLTQMETIDIDVDKSINTFTETLPAGVCFFPTVLEPPLFSRKHEKMKNAQIPKLGRIYLSSPGGDQGSTLDLEVEVFIKNEKCVDSETRTGSTLKYWGK